MSLMNSNATTGGLSMIEFIIFTTIFGTAWTALEIYIERKVNK